MTTRIVEKALAAFNDFSAYYQHAADRFVNPDALPLGWLDTRIRLFAPLRFLSDAAGFCDACSQCVDQSVA